MQTIIGREFPNKVIPLIQNAKQTIKICVFDWRWYPNDPSNSVQLFNQSIVGAVRRGVAVCAISNSNDIVRTLKEVGCFAKKLISKNLVHAKIMVIDDKILVVGSHNYTQHAFTMNYEFSVIVDDPEAVAGALVFFNNLYNSNG